MLYKVQFKSARDFGEVINDTFVFIKQNFKPLIKVYFYFCGLFLIGSSIAAVLHQFNLQNAVTEAGMNANRAAQNSIFALPMLLTVVFGVLNYTAGVLAILSFITLYVEKGNIAPSLIEVWGYFRFYFLRVLASGFLIILILAACLVFLILPFFYVLPAMSLLPCVMVVENGSFLYSFRKSFKLLSNQWWVTFGTLIILWIVTYAGFTTVTLPGIFMGLTNQLVNSAAAPHPALIIVLAIFQRLANVFMIIPIVGASLIYFNLVERQENLGLFDRINQLGEAGPVKEISEQY